MLQLIIGKSGCGKTEYVFNSIKELVDKNEEVLLITPEQFSFVAERRLLKDLGEAKLTKAKNLSFSRLNDEIVSEYGAEKLPVLSKGAKAVMMQKAALMVQDSLCLYSKKVNQSSFVNSMVAIYDEMKSGRVSSDDIFSASKEVENDKKILSSKLTDIATIISAYDALIDGVYLDSADNLTRLYKKLLNIEYFKNKTVFIDGFSGFVAQEYKIIEVILKQAKKVYITFCTDNSMVVDKNSLFYYVQRNIAILKSVAKDINSEVLDSIVLDKNYRYNNEELSTIENNAYSNLKKTIDSTNNVKIYSAKNIVDECNYTANNIVKLLRAGYKASDIVVISRDLEAYEKELEFAFSKYNVPYFDDERQNIANQPIIMFVNFLLRTSIYSMRSDDIFSLIKTGLTALDDESVQLLENYVYLWNINGSQWKTAFSKSTKGFVETITSRDQDLINKIECARQYIVEKLIKFNKSSSGKNCENICKAIYYTLLDFKCDEGLKSLAIELDKNGKSALADEQGRVWDLLMQILDKLAVIGGTEVVTIKEFYKLFNLMISNEDLGTVPTGLDNIQIGAANRIRCNNPKVTFVLGANEGVFPHATTSSGLLTESDRISLINNNFKLYSYGEILNAQEKYFAYMAMSSPSDKLFVSYNNEANPSSIVSEITDSIPNLKIESSNNELCIDSIESKDNAFELLSSNYDSNTSIVESLKEYFNRQNDYSSRLTAINNIHKNDELSVKDKSLSTALFGKDMYLSASRIEDYFACSFRYFCKFGINARPRQKAEMNPMQTGTVVHYVLEQLIKKNTSDGLITMSNSQIVTKVNIYLNEFLTSMMGNSDEFTPRFKYQFMRLSRLIVRLVQRLRDEFMNSDFKARAFELEIGNDADVEPKVVKLDDGGSVIIRGAIDRVDTYTENGKQYVRVVDYKNTKKFCLSDILSGLNLQMFIYLFALCESNHELSGIESGVLYLQSYRSVFGLDRNAQRKDIDKKETDGYRMIGVVLNDVEHEIACHMEHDLEGKYIPVKLKKDALVGDMLSFDEIKLISRKIDSLIQQMGTDLHNGVIYQRPVYNKNHDKTCEHCDYKSVCMNRPEIEKFVADDLSTSEVINKLKEDEQNA